MLTSKSDISDFDVLKNVYCTMTDVKNWVKEGNGVVIHSSGKCLRMFHNCVMRENRGLNTVNVKPRKVVLTYVNVPMDKISPIMKTNSLKDCQCILREKAVWLGQVPSTKGITSKYYDLKA